MKIVDIELIQDKYTNFIVYDGSDRTNTNFDWIEVQDISKIEITFKSTSEYLTDNMTYVLDDTKAAIHVGNTIFTSKNFSTYDAAEDMTINVNGTEYSVEIDTNMANIAALVAELSSQLSSAPVVVYSDGNYVAIRTTDVGASQYIQVISGTLLDTIGWRPGIYRGHTISWGDSSLVQKDIQFTIYPEDLNFNTEIPDGKWDIQIHVEYDEGVVTHSYQDNYTEYSYMLLSIYRAKWYEYIAKNFRDFDEIEQRSWTDDEKLMYRILQFDAAFRAFLAAVEVGNEYTSDIILDYLRDFKTLNPMLS